MTAFCTHMRKASISTLNKANKITDTISYSCLRWYIIYVVFVKHMFSVPKDVCVES